MKIMFPVSQPNLKLGHFDGFQNIRISTVKVKLSLSTTPWRRIGSGGIAPLILW